MIETIIGAIIGAVVSIIISETYYKKTSKGTERILSEFKENNDELKGLIENLEEWQNASSRLIDEIHKQSIKGTPMDPEFPYK